MTQYSIKQLIHDDIKNAMRAKDRPVLATLRLIMAAFKQIEVDQRIDIDDAKALVILDKMVKQRKDSIEQYQKAQRMELADIEQAEIEIIQKYLPTPLTEQEIQTLVQQAIDQVGATDMKQMGQVMGILKPQLQGRADMGKVSPLIKQHLSN